METKNKQFEAICFECKTAAILETEEMEAGEYTCPECSHINKFTILDVKEIVPEDESEQSEVQPEETKKNKKKLYIIGGVCLIILGIIYFAYTSDTIKFINAKEKADKHLKAGNELITNLMTNQSPDTTKMKEALDEYTKALELNNTLSEASVRKAEILISSGRVPEALSELNKALGNNPNSAEIYFYRAFCNAQMRQMQNALSDFDKALELNPTFAEAYFFRAQCRYFLQDKQGAIKDFDKTLEINPSNPEAVYLRSKTKFDIKDYKGSMEDMNVLIKSDSAFAEGIAIIGQCRIFLGEKTKGCDDLKKAKTLGFPGSDSLINLYCK
jgi:tetratricopeptide (TPR) repeat protein/DNA-directed RNA polymerase subunit RPC12/RpoP